LNALEHVRLAASSLSRHRLRTGLTTLGIIIGVASIVAMVSFGLGARSQIEAEISRLGSNMLMVVPNTRTTDGVSSQSGSQRTLTEADAFALSQELAGAQFAVPGVTGKVHIVLGNKNWQTNLAGTLPDYIAVRDWKVKLGRNFTHAEVASSAKVALIGATVAARLSPGHAILGEVVRVGSVPFRVVGILHAKGFSVVGGDQDDVMIVPLTSAKSRLVGGYRQVNKAAVEFILIKGRETAELDAVSKEVERVLRDRHRLAAGRDNDFLVHDPAAALAARKESSRTLTIMLAGVASVSLIVGGISVMNIMLVSVIERTREIGIRIAVGARRKDIRRQFLTEAIGVATLGGAVGAALGIFIAYGVGAITGWQVRVDWLALAGAMAFSSVVGIVSGLYPAIQASKLNPVDALRRE
jgi:putative ABC transport system permease protein